MTGNWWRREQIAVGAPIGLEPDEQERGIRSPYDRLVFDRLCLVDDAALGFVEEATGRVVLINKNPAVSDTLCTVPKSRSVVEAITERVSSDVDSCTEGH